MLRQRRITPVRQVPEDPSRASPLHVPAEAFAAWTVASGLAEQTALIRRAALGHFIRWCHGHSIESLEAITSLVLEDYQSDLSQRRKANGSPLALSTQVARLYPLKAFCKWLVRTRRIAINPAAELAVPSIPRRLPGRVMTPRETEQVLAQPDVGTPAGVRDRAILELLYSTGIRRMELVRIELRDVLLDRGTLFVRRGKGGRDRVVPIGSRANRWVDQYLRDVRQRLVPENQTGGILFLTDYGEPFRKNRLGDLVKRYIGKARLPLPGACHPFRHACATHMLENGADIRFIQALLGHADLSTTQIYTRVSIEKLREVHARTHPTGQGRRLPLEAA